MIHEVVVDVDGGEESGEEGSRSEVGEAGGARGEEGVEGARSAVEEDPSERDRGESEEGELGGSGSTEARWSLVFASLVAAEQCDEIQVLDRVKSRDEVDHQWVEGGEDGPEPERDEEAEERGERGEPSSGSDAEEEDGKEREGRGEEGEEGEEFERWAVGERSEDDPFFFEPSSRVGGAGPGVGPAGEGVSEEDAAFGGGEDDAAARGEHGEDAEALLGVVPSDEEEHGLEHRSEGRSGARGDGVDGPDGERDRDEQASDPVAKTLERGEDIAERAPPSVLVEEDVGGGEVRIVDEMSPVEGEEPHGVLGRVEPDEAPGEPRQREEQQGSSADEEELDDVGRGASARLIVIEDPVARAGHVRRLPRSTAAAGAQPAGRRRACGEQEEGDCGKCYALLLRPARGC